MSKGRVAGQGRASRSAITGRYVTPRTAARQPQTTVTERTIHTGTTRSRSATSGSYAVTRTAPQDAVAERDDVMAGVIAEGGDSRRRSTAPTRSTTGRPRSTAADDPLAPERTRWLADAVGGLGRLATMLGVSASQTSRWSRGEERPGVDAAPLLIDLEHVIARVRLVFAEPSAGVWMTSANTHLDGARPIDVLALSGSGPVLDALDAQTWGGAA